MVKNNIYDAIKSKIPYKDLDILGIYEAKDKYIFALYDPNNPDEVLMDNLMCIDLNFKKVHGYGYNENPKELTEALNNVVYSRK